MGGVNIPLPALGVKPVDVGANIGQAMQLRQLMAANQMGQIQLQQAQQDQHDRDTIRQIMQTNQGDPDKTLQDAMHAGVSPGMIMSLQQQSIAAKTAMAKLQGDQLANYKQINGNILDEFQAVANAPPEKQASVYAVGRTKAMQNPQAFGITDPTHVPPEQFPGMDWVNDQIATHQTADSHFNQEMKRREVAAQEVAAQARATAAGATAEKVAPLAPPQIDQLNKTLQDRFQVLNPGQPLPSQYTLQPGAKQADYNTIDKALQQVEQAQSVKASQQNAQATRAVAQATQANTRSDKSYQFNSTQLENVAKPIDASIQRLSRLNDTLAQNSPQGDALVAPELLSVMAGGAGSGLRMNEAEISRIVGGRSKWQSLQASINQWSLDPSKANSITPEQRQQIHALTDAVNQKLQAKQSAIDDARQQLLATDDPGQHRKIVAKARSKMTSIDQGPSQAAPNKTGGPPAGATHTAPGSDGKIHWTNEKGEDLGVKQ